MSTKYLIFFKKSVNITKHPYAKVVIGIPAIKPEDISLEAEEELQSHFKEPHQVVLFPDGTDMRFNTSDIVAATKRKDIDENDKEFINYTIELLSGHEIPNVPKQNYLEILKTKQWSDEDK